MEGNDTSVRILDLLFDLTSAERGRSRSQIRRLTHYRALSDDAFDSAFSRDKNTLKRVGVEITVRRRGDEAIYRIAAQSQQSVDFSADEIALIDLAASAWQTSDATQIAATKLRAHMGSHSHEAIQLRLSGCENVLPLYQAITSESVVSFVYRSPKSTQTRAVEPWNLVVSGSAIYLQGFDLDREGERTFRLSRILGPIEVLGEPGDARTRSPRSETIDISRPLQPIFAVRGASAAFQEAQIHDVPLEEGTGEWQLYTGHLAPYHYWLQFVLLYAADCVPLSPEPFVKDLRSRLEKASHRKEVSRA